jgi:putative ABC transport system substrate-binding protein
MSPKAFESRITNMKRSSLSLILIAALLLGFRITADAQQPKKIPRIGYLTLLVRPDSNEEAFLMGLRELGYIDGQNIIIEYRRTGGNVEPLAEMAAELVRQHVDLIVARSTPVVQAAKNATRTIPVVMFAAADPVESGLVKSLARPGGNVTGMSNIQPELAGKELELLREVVPKLSRVAFLGHSGDPAHKLFLKQAHEAAERFRVKLQPVLISAPEQIEAALSEILKDRPAALIIQPLFIRSLGQGPKIGELAAKNQLPTISAGVGFADEGGLLFYGPDIKERNRRVAVYVDKILEGANLPISLSSSRQSSSW